MTKERTPNDICFLCKKNKADKKGSHFTPIGLLKKVVGKRGFEHEVTIDPFEGTVSEFFGRSNLKNTDPTIRKSDNVADYIFCTDCETKLGIIESECIEKLQDFSTSLLESTLSIEQTPHGNSCFRFQKPNKNIVTLFFYSIIWRQILNDTLLHKVQFTPAFVEILRYIVFHEINKSLADIEKSKDYINYPKLIIYTTYHTDDPTGYPYGPNPYPSNPELFTIGIYETLIFIDNKISENFSLATKLPASIVDAHLIINNSNEGIIGIIDFKTWEIKNMWFYAKYADDFIATYVKKIVDGTGLSTDEAEALLKKEPYVIPKPITANSFSDFFNTAVAKIIKNYSKP